MHGVARLPAAVLALLLLIVAACAPLPGGEATATLLTAGEGVVHNGRPATSGERLNTGDWVRTGYAGAALISFSDGTTIRIAEAEEPVHLYWSGHTLSIRTEGTLIETVTGAVIEAVRMITDLASVFNGSHFITVLEANEFRHFLLTGQARMIFPQPGLPILPGQYALVAPGGEVSIRPIPDRLLSEVRGKLDRWSFERLRPGSDSRPKDEPENDIDIWPGWPSEPMDDPRRSDGPIDDHEEPDPPDGRTYPGPDKGVTPTTPGVKIRRPTRSVDVE